MTRTFWGRWNFTKLADLWYIEAVLYLEVFSNRIHVQESKTSVMSSISVYMIILLTKTKHNQLSEENSR